MASQSDAGWPGFVLVAFAAALVLVALQLFVLGGQPVWLPGLAGSATWLLLLFGLAVFGRWLCMASGTGPRYASFAGLAIMIVCVVAGVFGLI